jgi:hypothetical protein
MEMSLQVCTCSYPWQLMGLGATPCLPAFAPMLAARLSGHWNCLHIWPPAVLQGTTPPESGPQLMAMGAGV